MAQIFSNFFGYFNKRRFLSKAAAASFGETVGKMGYFL